MFTTASEDFLVRLIRRAAEFIARALGLRAAGDHDAALAELDAAWGELFGMPPGLIDALELPALVQLLGAPERVRVAAQLLDEEAAAWRAKGNEAIAQMKSRRASDLRAAADDR